MSRYKKPDAPKFEPVVIADYRLAVRSLLTPEDDRRKMLEEDGSRIAMEKTMATAGPVAIAAAPAAAIVPIMFRRVTDVFVGGVLCTRVALVM